MSAVAWSIAEPVSVERRRHQRVKVRLTGRFMRSDRQEFDPVVFVARREGEIVGILRAEFRPPSAHMRELLIAASARGQGIARHLLAAFDFEARNRNCERVTANILHGCEAEGYMRHLGWNDDSESIVFEHGREMVRLAKVL